MSGELFVFVFVFVSVFVYKFVFVSVHICNYFCIYTSICMCHCLKSKDKLPVSVHLVLPTAPVHLQILLVSSLQMTLFSFRPKLKGFLVQISMEILISKFFALCNSLKFLQSKWRQWNLRIRRIWQTMIRKQWKTMGR